ncbi:hypothetical protein AcV7_005172 [Taiwanofungus camphoratus]|nr:hypothetical protein AcV7_005172 [Antrodia cinnamomea]
METMSSSYSFYPFWIHFRYYPCASHQTDITMIDGAEPNFRPETDDTKDQHPKQGNQSEPLYMDKLRAPKTPPRQPYATTQGTPFKSKAHMYASGEDGIIVDEGVKRYVRAHFRDKVHRGMPVREFIRAVWDFTSKDVPYLQEESIPKTHVEEYMQSRFERESYIPLVNLLRHIIGEISSGERRERQRRVATFGERLGTLDVFRLRERTVKGDYTVALKPDLALGTTRSEELRRWEWYLGFIEVKKGVGKQDQAEFELPLEKPENVGQSTLVKATSSRRKGLLDHLTTTKRKVPATIFEDDERPSKRSRSNINGDDDASMSIAPPEHINRELDPNDQPMLTDHEVQAGKYMNELLSHGVRSFATGCMIKSTLITLWYGDRMGIVQSEPFDFILNPDLLVLFLAAMESADHARMGICPFLKFPTGTYENYSGVQLELDDQLAIDVNETPLEKVVFKVDESRRVITDFGAVGRGTTIVPIKATGRAKALFGEDELVAKMAWPSKERDAEDGFVRTIRQGLKTHAPRWLDHVVDLKCSITRNMEQMDLPRFYMNGLLDYEERIFRLMVMKKYEVLEQVNSVDEFKKVFVDVVNAHHWVWTTSGILHRDISANNIMFYRKDGQVMGVLCDWDLAMKEPSKEEYMKDMREDIAGKVLNDDIIFEYSPVVDDDKTDETSQQQDPKSTTNARDSHEGDKQADPLPAKAAKEEPHKRPRYRTGTGPFMALDLLSVGRVPLHRYRFDLESFFFVLAWVCAVFDPVQHAFGHFPDWECPKLSDIGCHKTLFIIDDNHYETAFRSAHPDYKALATSWVEQLRTEMVDVTLARIGLTRLRCSLRKARANGDLEKAESVSAEMSKAHERLDELMTYEVFMKALGLPTSEPR